MARIIEVTDLILRDAQQSLLETSMALEDVIPVCEDLDNAGYWSLECWGGASFDSCIRLLNEDPWERLRTYRKLLPKTRLQMLLRGQNLLAYRNFDDSIVNRFVEKAALNGIDVFRVYDAFNDVRNLKASLEAVQKNWQACARINLLCPKSGAHDHSLCGHGATDKGNGLRLNLPSRRGRYS